MNCKHFTIAFSLFFASCGKNDQENKKNESGSGKSEGESENAIQIVGTLSVSEQFDQAVAFTVSGTSISSAPSQEVPIGVGKLAFYVNASGQSLSEDDNAATVIMVVENQDNRLDSFDSVAFVNSPTVSNEPSKPKLI